MTHIIQISEGNLSGINKYVLMLLVLISTYVIADQNIPLDLNFDLDLNSVSNIISRNDWREVEQEDKNWRKQPVLTENNKNWEPDSVYENNNQLLPLLTDENKPSGVLDDRQAAPTFKLRF